MLMPGRLEDKVAIVTGAGRGIGRATAALLAGEGADVACVARTGPELAEAAAGVRAAGRRAIQIQADIGDPDAAGLIAAQVQAVLGDVDIVVNNAATVTPVGPTASIDPDQWARALAVNVAGPMRLTRALLDGMVKRGWGRIVNVSSGIAAAPGAMVGMNAYAASKAALEAHTLNLAAELAGTGVTVNVLRPGMVDTAMPAWIRAQPPEQIGAALHDRFMAMRDSGLMAAPARPAGMIVNLVVGEATGQIADAGSMADVRRQCRNPVRSADNVAYH
jgi:NAD(P)-dependent dehydrogenase (short-subunit alcohol dehydrogenase family)